MATSKSRGTGKSGGSKSRSPRGKSSSAKKATPAPARRDEALAEETADVTAREREIDLDVDESPDAVEARREAQSGPGAPGVPHTGSPAPSTRRAGEALDESAEDEHRGLDPDADERLDDEADDVDLADEELRSPDEKHGH